MDQDQEETLTYMEEVAEAIINVQEQLDLRFGEVVALADIHKVDNLLGTIEVMRHTAQAEQVVGAEQRIGGDGRRGGIGGRVGPRGAPAAGLVPGRSEVAAGRDWTMADAADGAGRSSGCVVASCVSRRCRRR